MFTQRVGEPRAQIRGSRLARADLGGTATVSASPTPPEAGDGPIEPLDAVIREHIRRALVRTNGQVHGAGGAGELLGVNPNTLRAKMRKHGIAFGQRGRG